MSELLARLPEPNEVEPAPGSAISGLTKLVVGVTVIVALYLGQQVLVPVILAVLLSFLLAPPVDWPGIGTFNAQGIRTLRAAYLEITETPSHVRYLLQRPRQRLPAALWSSDCGRPGTPS
jgi:hypothetical protein